MVSQLSLGLVRSHISHPCTRGQHPGHPSQPQERAVGGSSSSTLPADSPEPWWSFQQPPQTPMLAPGDPLSLLHRHTGMCPHCWCSLTLLSANSMSW